MWLSGGLLAGSGRSRGPGRELVGPAIKRARCVGNGHLTVS
jgi:hypothetical protein